MIDVLVPSNFSIRVETQGQDVGFGEKKTKKTTVLVFVVESEAVIPRTTSEVSVLKHDYILQTANILLPTLKLHQVLF